MSDHMRPYLENPFLRFSYSVIAPLYDLAISLPLHKARSQSLKALPTDLAKKVLLSGVGTGLDLPLLPKLHRYTALDFNSGMLARAKPRGAGLQVEWVLGDSMELPFADAQFECCASSHRRCCATSRKMPVRSSACTQTRRNHHCSRQVPETKSASMAAPRIQPSVATASHTPRCRV